MHGNQRSNFCSCEQAVAGRAVVQKNDMAGLFAAKNVSAAKHLFQNVAITDGGARQRDVFAGKNALKSEVGHRGSNDTIAF